MRKLLTLLLLFPISLTAQEKYFHELKGMEDSTGTTHLFYRIYESYRGCYGGYSNSVYHLDTNTYADSISLNEYGTSFQFFDDCYWESHDINEYEILNNDPSLIFFNGVSVVLDPAAYLSVTNKNFYISTFFNPARFLEFNMDNDSVFFTAYSYKNDKYASFKISLPDTIASEVLELNLENMDSLALDFYLTDIHPFYDGVYYRAETESGNLFRSTDFGKSFELVENELTNWDSMNELTFSPESDIIYSSTKNSFSSDFKLVKSDRTGSSGSWSIIRGDSSEIFYSTDKSDSLLLFISDYKEVLVSKNSGATFEFFRSFEHQIKGLYKKPGSNILYVLTTDELFEVNTETKAVTSLKKLPVSNEEPKETPSSIKLHQNYPNPFNPFTTISFELDRPAEVTLTIFDALGRVVSVLMDEQRTTGLHEISFDASSLSSGIYFYQLKVGAFAQTKRFTLIK